MPSTLSMIRWQSTHSVSRFDIRLSCRSPLT